MENKPTNPRPRNNNNNINSNYYNYSYSYNNKHFVTVCPLGGSSPAIFKINLFDY